MSETDFIQDVREGVVAIIDTHADVIAITGRESENIVAWNPKAKVTLPVYAYQFIDADELAADGDTRMPVIQFSASAEDEDVVHNMLGVIERILTQNAFLSLTPPLDAFVERQIRRGFNLDVTLRVSRPTPVPA